MAKYFVPDLGLNSSADSPLSGVLDRLDTNNRLSDEDKKYLRDKGLFDLHRFAKELEQGGRPDYSILSIPFEATRAQHIRARLRSDYGIDDVHREHVKELVAILQRIEAGDRFADKDVVWLKERKHFTPQMRQKFHLHEARFYSQSFEKTRDPWQAVNGCSEFRNAELPDQALSLISRVDQDPIRDNHLRSAICTTMGGARRDLGDFKNALSCAQEGHALDPGSFHPCTLLGAVYYELEDYSQGDQWFRKAVERGAKTQSVDSELRTIFLRTDQKKRGELRQHLLSIDPVRYGWVNSIERRR